ncbi:hypothetical protein GW17_00007130 [Ensete ventricosum]|nr:hypothetical protein GW17_00007130 [Ensete ventricosum]
MDRAAVTVGPGMDMPIMHDSDRYELVRDIGSGNFGIARLMRDKQTRELVAVKYIVRGEKVGWSSSCTEHTDTWYTKVPSCAKSTGHLLDWYVPSVLSGKVFFTGKACTARYVPVWQLTGTRADRYRAVPLKSTVDD